MAYILPLPPSTPPPMDDSLGGSEEDDDFPPVTPYSPKECLSSPHHHHSLTEVSSIRPYLIENSEEESIFLKFAEKKTKKLPKERMQTGDILSVQSEDIIFHGTEHCKNLSQKEERACDTSLNPSNIPSQDGFASFDTKVKLSDSSLNHAKKGSPVHLFTLHESEFQQKGQAWDNCDNPEPVQNGNLVGSDDELGPRGKKASSLGADVISEVATLPLQEKVEVFSDTEAFRTSADFESGSSHRPLNKAHFSESEKEFRAIPEFNLARTSSEEFPEDNIPSPMADKPVIEDAAPDFVSLAISEHEDDFDNFADFKMADLNEVHETQMSEKVSNTSQDWVCNDFSSTNNDNEEDGDEFADFESATFVTKTRDHHPQENVTTKLRVDPQENFANFENAWSNSPEDDEFAGFEAAPVIPQKTEAAALKEVDSPTWEENESMDDFADFIDAPQSTPQLTLHSDSVPLIIQNAFPYTEEASPDGLPTNPLLDGESLKLWTKLAECENGLAFSWPRSKAFRLVLSSLNMSLVASPQSVPLFAVNLGLLEPTPANQTPSFDTPEAEQQVLPELPQPPQPQQQDDWSQQPLNLDFLGTVAEEVAAVTEEEAPATLPKVSNLLTHLMAQHQELSAEARRILERLPDLSYMTSPVLMFPLSS